MHVELNSFFFQFGPLDRLAGTVPPLADLAPRIDDTKPRDFRTGRQFAEDRAHLPGIPRNTRQSRNLTIRRDAPPGNLPYDHQDAGCVVAVRHATIMASSAPDFEE